MDDTLAKRKRQSMTEHEPSKSQQAPHGVDRAVHAIDITVKKAPVGNAGVPATESKPAVSSEQPWHAPFPAPTLTAEVMPRDRMSMILSMKIASLLIVDVRRVDYEGGFIRGSINIPAQGFWWNRGMLYELAYKSGMEWVVFTCGSSNGRGPRCAGWFLDHVRTVAEDEDMQVMVLEGGIKGWVKAGPQYTRLMDGYSEEYWTELFDAQANPTSQKPSADIAPAVGAGDVAP